MVKLDLRQILKETRKSVYNGRTIKQLEQWKSDLKKLDDREDKRSLRDAIMILELVIELKKTKKKNPINKFKQSFLFIMFIFLLVGISASINYNVGGSNKLVVAEDISTFSTNVSIEDNSVIDISSLDFFNGSRIAEGNSMIISTGINSAVRVLIGATLREIQIQTADLNQRSIPIQNDNTSTVFLGSVDNFDDINDFSRFRETNLNNGSFAVAGFQGQNDLNQTMNFGITSSGFSIGGMDIPSEGVVFSLAANGTTFSNFLFQSFDWFVNKDDSVLSFDFEKIASLSPDGNFTIDGNYTGNQIQLRSVEPKHTCDNEAKGTIVYEGNGTSGDFFGCKQLNAMTFVWRKLS